MAVNPDVGGVSLIWQCNHLKSHHHLLHRVHTHTHIFLLFSRGRSLISLPFFTDKTDHRLVWKKKRKLPFVCVPAMNIAGRLCIKRAKIRKMSLIFTILGYLGKKTCWSLLHKNMLNAELIVWIVWYFHCFCLLKLVSIYHPLRIDLKYKSWSPPRDCLVVCMPVVADNIDFHIVLTVIDLKKRYRQHLTIRISTFLSLFPKYTCIR